MHGRTIPSHSVPATPLQGHRPEDVTPQRQSQPPVAPYTVGSGVITYAQLQSSVPPTPAAFPTAKPIVPTSSPFQPIGNNTTIKTDPASLQNLMAAVAAETQKMKTLQSNIQQLSQVTSPSKPQPPPDGAATVPIKPQLPRPPPVATSSTHHSFPPTVLQGRPLVSFSPSPPTPSVLGPLVLPPSVIPEPVVDPNEVISPVSASPLWENDTPTIATVSDSRHRRSSSGPISPRSANRRASPTFIASSPSPLPPIEEVVQNLNDSFASVATDNSSSPVRAAATPSTATEMKRVIRTQRENMHMAGEYGSKLIGELEAAHRENEQLKSKLETLAQQAELASGQVAALRAVGDFIRAEAMAWNQGERSLASSGVAPAVPHQPVQVTGVLSEDLAVFQHILRTQRKHNREETARLIDELEATKRVVAGQQASIASLTHASAMWQQLQQAHHQLQQQFSDAEVQGMELQTKLKIEASKHQTMMQMLTEQLQTAKDEHTQEMERVRAQERSKRDGLEKQITELKAQLASVAATSSVTAVDPTSAPAAAAPSHRTSSSLDITLTSSSGETSAVGPPMPPARQKQRKRVSLAADLAGEEEENDKSEAQSSSSTVAPADSTAVASTEPIISRLSDHFDRLLAVESTRQEQRSSWHESESLWFFERARLREVEQQALEMRKDEREEELATLKELYDITRLTETNESLREQLKQTQEREANLRQGQEHILSESLEKIMHVVEEKDTELAMLRAKLDQQQHTIHTHSTPQKEPATPKDQLSTPALKASRDIPHSRRFTPPTHQRPTVPSDSHFSSVSLPPQVIVREEIKTDTRVLNGVTEVSTLTRAVLHEVRGSRRSIKWFLTWIFLLQILFVGVWFVLTSGGGSVLADHPLVQTMLSFIDGAAPAVMFQS